jgi:chromosome segregation ATPase
MARESTITYEQVAAAANAIKAQGGKATTRAVREALGTGSMATVLKFIQQWQGGQVRQSAVIDDTLDATIARAISNQIAVRLQSATADATAKLADLQTEVDALIIENERQVGEIVAQSIEFATLQSQYAQLTGRTQQLEADSARITAELIDERRATESARVELAKAELRLEAVPKVEAEIEKLRAELLQARAHAAELHEAAAVATAKLDAEVIQRKACEAQLLEANRRNDDSAKRIEALAESLTNERLLVKTCQTNLELTTRDLAAANQSLDQSRQDAKQSVEVVVNTPKQNKSSPVRSKPNLKTQSIDKLQPR